MKTCFFIGHREAPDSLFPLLSSEVERHIMEYGVKEFVVGNYGHFDRLASQSVREIKKRHSKIRLTLLLPYYPFNRTILMPCGFDGTFYPSEMENVPKRAAIIRANQYMINHSDYLIAYAWHPSGNAQNLVEYALKRQAQGFINVVNLNHYL